VLSLLTSNQIDDKSLSRDLRRSLTYTYLVIQVYLQWVEGPYTHPYSKDGISVRVAHAAVFQVWFSHHVIKVYLRQ
jgi:hypothetical protein